MKQDKNYVEHLQTDVEFWKGVDKSYKNLGKLAIFMTVVAFLMHYFN